ncbi:transposase family protein [Myxococcus sp. SDU36]|nr:transposase family protein [Myxococcus sp. SDU36]
MARPTKLTPELQQQICEHLRSGLFRRAAAGLVGVDEQTVSRWFHRGASEARGLYREFFVAVDRAEAEFMQGATETLQAAATTNPKHVQWLLSRRFPELYGRRDNVEAKSPEDQAADTAALRELLIDRLGKFLPDEPPASAPADAAPSEQLEDKGAGDA